MMCLKDTISVEPDGSVHHNKGTNMKVPEADGAPDRKTRAIS